MKLAALGVVTVGLGLVMSIPGLMWIGLFWVAMGIPVRLHGQKLEELRDSTPDGARALAMDGRTFTLGTLLFLALGMPSLAVGVLELGFDPGDENWRWLPVAVGVFAPGIGLIGGFMYLTGSALGAIAGAGADASTPATIWIRATRETGTFVNERPRLELDLKVEPDSTTGVAAYEVTKKATVPFTALAYTRVGDGFRARVAGPEDPTSMEIEWDQPVSGSS